MARRLRLILAIVLALSIPISMSGAYAAGPSAPGYPLYPMPESELGPDVSAGTVAFYTWDGDESLATIYSRVLSTGDLSVVATLPASPEYPQLEGVWYSYMIDVDSVTNGIDLWATNIVSGETTIVSDGAGTQEWHQADGSRIVYESWESGRSDADVWMYDLATGAHTLIAGTNADERFPDITGDYVGYYDNWVSSRASLYDLATTTESEIATDIAGSIGDGPLMGGGRIVFGAGDETNAFYEWDPVAGTSTLIPTQEPYETWGASAVAFDGTTLVYKTEADDGDSLRAFDMGTDTDRLVCDWPSGHNFPQVDGNTLIWSEDRWSDITGENNRDIYTEGTPSDSTPPVTTATGIPAGWTTSEIEFSLEATDTSGVVYTWYRQYNADYDTGFQIWDSETRSVSWEGTTTIEFGSIDYMSNYEDTQTVQVRIDESTPNISDNYKDLFPADDSATIELEASDEYSGVANVYYRINGGPITEGTSIEVSRAGTNTVEYWALDNAGNSSSIKTHDDAIVHVTETEYVPIEGADRYKTAVKASQEAFPRGIEGTDFEGYKTAVLATGANWPDALGAASLAGALGGPVLLTKTSSLPADVATEIERLNADRVIIVGGTAAVSEEVAQAVDAIDDVLVDRIAGTDRYKTADQVAERTIEAHDGDYDGSVFMATGTNFPDALAASPLAAATGRPLLLSKLDGPKAGTLTVMADNGVNYVLLLGGEGAISEAAEIELAKTFGLMRLDGANRYSTAVRIAWYGVHADGLIWDGVAFATGDNFPDALAGGVAQGLYGAPVLLTKSTYLRTEPKQVLQDNRDLIGEVRYLGGAAAISQTVRDQVEAELHPAAP